MAAGYFNKKRIFPQFEIKLKHLSLRQMVAILNPGDTGDTIKIQKKHRWLCLRMMLTKNDSYTSALFSTTYMSFVYVIIVKWNAYPNPVSIMAIWGI